MVFSIVSEHDASILSVAYVGRGHFLRNKVHCDFHGVWGITRALAMSVLGPFLCSRISRGQASGGSCVVHGTCHGTFQGSVCRAAVLTMCRHQAAPLCASACAAVVGGVACDGQSPCGTTSERSGGCDIRVHVLSSGDARPAVGAQPAVCLRPTPRHPPPCRGRDGMGPLPRLSLHTMPSVCVCA